MESWPLDVYGLIPFNRLSCVTLIRHGDITSIYKAELTDENKPVILKVLTSDESICRERFIQEAAILKSLKHKYTKFNCFISD